MSNLSIDFCGISFPNPLVLPSGIIQEIPDHIRAVKAGVGGVTLKTLTPKKREGNPIPRVVRYKHGVLNSVGFRNPGIKEGIDLARKFINSLSCIVRQTLSRYYTHK